MVDFGSRWQRATRSNPQLHKLQYYWRSGAPVVTYTVMVMCLAVWVVEMLLRAFSPSAFTAMVNYGSDNPLLDLRRPWQWFTAMFLHAPGVWHVACNMLTLLSIGPFLEKTLGHGNFVALYLISGFGGSVGLDAYCRLSGNWLISAYGASGALFGLFGAVLIVFRRAGQDIRSMVVLIAINFAMPLLVPNMAWQAHVGGFVTGLVLTWLIVDGVPALRRYRFGVRTAIYGAAVVVVLVAVLLLCRPPAYIQPMF